MENMVETDDKQDEVGYDCDNCGSQTYPDIVQIVLWEPGREVPVIISDVPARVCKNCGEQFYSDDTNLKIDLLRNEGFSGKRTLRFVQVPVFSLK